MSHTKTKEFNKTFGLMSNRLSQVALVYILAHYFFFHQVGSWAGNLMLKHAHQGFQSDIFLTLLAAKAELTIGNAENNSITHMDLEQFLRTDMFRKVILSVTLPAASPNTKVRDG